MAGSLSELLNTIQEAERKGGAEGLSVLRDLREKSCCSDAPETLDWALAKMEYLYGSREQAIRIAERGLRYGQSEPGLVYFAARERLREADELLRLRDLEPGIRRYLMDRAGMMGSPPAVPRLLPNGTILLQDSDGDLDDFGIQVWLQPDESLQPVTHMDGFAWYYQDETERRIHLQPGWDQRQEAVWYRSWAVDGRGHRVDSGLVKLALAADVTAAPGVAGPAGAGVGPTGPAGAGVGPTGPAPPPRPYMALGLWALLTGTLVLSGLLLRRWWHQGRKPAA